MITVKNLRTEYLDNPLEKSYWIDKDFSSRRNDKKVQFIPKYIFK
jgi:hypothetical protein